MARLLSYFILVSMNSVLFYCFSRTTKSVYKPYGPKMCRTLCEDLFYSFHYNVEDLSCHRVQRKVILKEIHPSENRVICSGWINGSVVTVGRDVCEGQNEDFVTTTQPRNTETEKTHGRQLDQYNPNISLHKACAEGKTDDVKHIVTNGMEDINCRDLKGRTPVMLAAQHRHADVFDFLVKEGCDLSVLDEYNDTVLHLACEGGNTDIVQKLLLTGKFDKDSKDELGHTPMMKAVEFGHRDTFLLLMSKNCSQGVVSNTGETLLHAAVIGGHVDMVRFILSQNIVSIDSKDAFGRTPVTTAVVYRRRKVFDLLVCAGGSLKVDESKKINLLHLVTMDGQLDMVKYILSLDICHIDSQDIHGRTPAMIASAKGHRDVLDFLVTEGCNITAVDEKENNILHMACINGHANIVKYVLILDTLNIDGRGIYGRTPVMLAAGAGHIRVIDLLISGGCNLQTVDGQNLSLLHAACNGGHVDAVKKIISLDIFPVDCKGYHERTPAFEAAMGGHLQVLRVLVTKGCNLRAVDTRGNTILHIASFFDSVKIVKYLITINALEEIKKVENIYGQTPIQIAESRDHRAIIRLLKD